MWGSVTGWVAVGLDEVWRGVGGGVAAMAWSCGFEFRAVGGRDGCGLRAWERGWKGAWKSGWADDWAGDWAGDWKGDWKGDWEGSCCRRGVFVQ